MRFTGILGALAMGALLGVSSQKYIYHIETIILISLVYKLIRRSMQPTDTGRLSLNGPSSELKILRTIWNAFMARV